MRPIVLSAIARRCYLADASEEAIQRAVAEFLRKATKAEEVVWWHVPNGGKRSKATAGRMKAMGVSRGVPDLHFMWSGKFGVIEMKDATGDMSPDQKEFAKSTKAFGHYFAECRTPEDVENTLRSWGVPLHGTLINSKTTIR